MAQRNPMNERYTGDGPGGQSRKSASSAKPAKQAASSVHIPKKPQTAAEKRAAQKAREKEAKAKAQEKERRAAEKAAKAAELAAAESAEGADGEAASSDGSDKGKKPASASAQLNAPMPKTEEYRKWRRVYWTLVVIGIIAIVISFFIQMNPGTVSFTVQMMVLAVAYPAIIGALIVDWRKVKPLVKQHQIASTGNKSPKQLKHEQEARDEAAAIEAARKAAKAAKRAPRRRAQTIVSGDAPDTSTEVPGQDIETVAPGEEK